MDIFSRCLCNTLPVPVCMGEIQMPLSSLDLAARAAEQDPPLAPAGFMVPDSLHISWTNTRAYWHSAWDKESGA